MPSRVRVDEAAGHGQAVGKEDVRQPFPEECLKIARSDLVDLGPVLF